MPLDISQLFNFTGTERWHKLSALFPKMLLTDGAKYVAENAGDAGAYWLMDAIASYQPQLQAMNSLKDFQLWTLEVDTKSKSATLCCRADSDQLPVVTQPIGYTDFDLPELRMYCMPAGDGIRYTILLPTEY